MRALPPTRRDPRPLRSPDVPAAGRVAGPVAGRDADRGDIVVGWLVRVVVLLAVAGVVAFDALSIGTSRLAVQDQAGAAARAAAGALADGGDLRAAYASAAAAAGDAHAGNQVPPAGFRIGGDGSVSLTVTRRADTVLVHRLGPLADWAQVAAAATRSAST